jgi:hypothetical protein
MQRIVHSDRPDAASLRTGNPGPAARSSSLGQGAGYGQRILAALPRQVDAHGRLDSSLQSLTARQGVTTRDGSDEGACGRGTRA